MAKHNYSTIGLRGHGNSDFHPNNDGDINTRLTLADCSLTTMVMASKMEKNHQLLVRGSS